MYNPYKRPNPNSTSDDAASAEHRRKLEAMFSRGSSPTAATAQLSQATNATPQAFSSPRRSFGRNLSDYRMRLNRLRNARDPNEIEEAADAFLKVNQLLPHDMEILVKVLQHPSERILRDAIEQISYLISKKRAGNTLLLTDRLRAIGTRQLMPVTQLYLNGLQDQLAKLNCA